MSIQDRVARRKMIMELIAREFAMTTERDAPPHPLSFVVHFDNCTSFGDIRNVIDAINRTGTEEAGCDPVGGVTLSGDVYGVASR